MTDHEEHDLGFSEEEAERGDRLYDEMVEEQLIEDLEYRDAQAREAMLAHKEAVAAGDPPLTIKFARQYQRKVLRAQAGNVKRAMQLVENGKIYTKWVLTQQDIEACRQH